MELKGYTNIPDWMLSLDLDVYETIILAVIYGFSQDGESTFAGSLKYLCQKAKCSRRKVTMEFKAEKKEKNMAVITITVPAEDFMMPMRSVPASVTPRCSG